MPEFKERLERALSERNMSPAELSRRAGVGEGAISQYRKGAYKASQRNLEKIATALGVSVSWLMGSDVTAPAASNIEPMPTMQKIPLLGTIACGEPILAADNIEDEVDIPEHIRADFALRCKGDSMINARIFDGDIVYIRQQQEVNNGQIAAVLIGDEATLKRVYYYPGRLELRPENPTFPVLQYEGSELENVQIIGLAVAFTSNVR